jgi:hypothetical protein
MPGDVDNGFFGHAVGQDVGPGVKKDGAAHGIRPEIIMGDAPQAGLDSAEDDGSGRLEMPPDQVGIGDHGPVGTTVVDAPGGEIIAAPPLSGGRVIGDHGIHAPAGHPPEQLRLPQPGDVAAVAYVRLGDDAHAIPRLHEHPADDRHPDMRGIDIAVARDQDYVQSFPSKSGDFFGCGGDKHGRDAPYCIEN